MDSLQALAFGFCESCIRASWNHDLLLATDDQKSTQVANDRASLVTVCYHVEWIDEQRRSRWMLSAARTRSEQYFTARTKKDQTKPSTKLTEHLREALYNRLCMHVTY